MVDSTLCMETCHGVGWNKIRQRPSERENVLSLIGHPAQEAVRSHEYFSRPLESGPLGTTGSVAMHMCTCACLYLRDRSAPWEGQTDHQSSQILGLTFARCLLVCEAVVSMCTTSISDLLQPARTFTKEDPETNGRHLVCII